MMELIKWNSLVRISSSHKNMHTMYAPHTLLFMVEWMSEKLWQHADLPLYMLQSLISIEKLTWNSLLPTLTTFSVNFSLTCFLFSIFFLFAHLFCCTLFNAFIFFSFLWVVMALALSFTHTKFSSRLFELTHAVCNTVCMVVSFRHSCSRDDYN